MNIAIIPARGGSKRIPRKNIKNFLGKPMIAYSIEAAIASECFDKIIVSTDDFEISEVAIQYGAEVPFIRPSNVSDDFSTTIDVIQHAIKELGLADDVNICCLYATAPFVTEKSLSEGLSLLSSCELDYAFSAAEFSFPIQRAFRLNENKKVEMFQPEHFNTRSQDLENSYHDAGQFYWGKCSAFKEGKPFFSSEAKPVILPSTRVQDIDTEEDWARAELIFKLLKEQSSVNE